MENSVKTCVSLAEFFTLSNIIESFMFYYKDYNYVTHILNLNFEEAWNFYLKMIDRIKAENEHIKQKLAWDLYLLELENGYQGSFEDYYKSKQHFDNSKIDRKSENERILNKYKDVRRVI